MRGDAVPADLLSVIARHLPDAQLRSVARLGAGLDNVAYEVDGEWIVRQRYVTDTVESAEATRREAALLAAVGPWSTLSVPEVAFVDELRGLLGYRLLPGRPLLDRPAVDPATVAPALGAFLSRLHAAPIAAFEQFVERDDEPLDGWLDDARSAFIEVASQLTTEQRRRVEDFLAETPPVEATDLVFCHNDLGAEHLLVDDAATLIGVIDWSDAAIADPAHDLGRLYRDVGPDAFSVVVDHYDHEVDGAMLVRTRFVARCALLEDLAFGLRTGDHRYSDAALRHLVPTFA